MSKQKHETQKAIADFFKAKMTPRQRKLLSAAIADLWDGPFDSAYMLDVYKVRWPGYVKAINELEKFWRDRGSDVWYDIQSGFVVDTEPEWADYMGEESYEEAVEEGRPVEWMENWQEWPSHDAAMAVFGRLISDGGMSP